MTTTTPGFAAITGSVQRPVARLRPATSAQQAYAAAFPKGVWVPERGWYELAEVPERFPEHAAGHGFVLAIDPALGAGRTVEQLRGPYATLQSDGLNLLVHPRLGGKDAAMEAAGWAAVWQTQSRTALMPLLDACRAGVECGPGVREAYVAAMSRDPRRLPFAAVAHLLASSPTWPAGNDHSSLVAGLGRELYAYQGPGALAAALGHGLVADPPGVGKTATSLATAHITKAARIVVACPPVLVTNWQREIVVAGIDDTPAAIRAGKPVPPLTSRCVVVADSLLHRPEVMSALTAWMPDLFIVDEAHRMKNRATQRSQAALTLAQHVGTSLALTGTPVVSGPHELVPVLELTGHLGPVFGGPSAFLERYCFRDRYGKMRANPANLPELHRLLMEHAMVRRPKDVVLPFLPKRRLAPVELEVPTKTYREQVKVVVAALTERLRRAQRDGRLDAAADELRASTGQFLAPLRQAAAMVKVQACVDMVAEMLEAGDGPVVVWAHHREPVDAVVAGLAARGIAAARLQGGTPDRARQAVVDGFQAGTVPVLVASMHAAGVGLTLTRGSRAIFLEADWTPALVSQAVDRQHRIGQERPVLAQVLIAVGTIDEHVQRVLGRKETTAAAIHGDAGDAVAVLGGDDLVTPAELVEQLLQAALKRLH